MITAYTVLVERPTNRVERSCSSKIHLLDYLRLDARKLALASRPQPGRDAPPVQAASSAMSGTSGMGAAALSRVTA